ncbi:MAG: hypothetical protein ACXV4A_13375 [Actinomycetes bacterium]
MSLGTSRDGAAGRSDPFDVARSVADAVLYEGYLLYPYRASTRKNQVRWQFGVVGPQAAFEAGVGEDPRMRTECLLEARAGTTVDVRLRFLQLQARSVERAVGGEFVPVPELRAGDRTWLSWDEAVEGELDVTGVAVDALLAAPRTVPFQVSGGQQTELLYDDAGSLVGRLRRRRWPVSGLLRVHGEPAAAVTDGRCVVLQVHLDNTGDWRGVAGDREASRDLAARVSFLSAHLVLAVRDGAFVSLLEPPDWATAAAAACDNHRCWPVLIGADGDRDTVLASPIILYDYPAVAAESAGELFDSTEIDEILTLRVMTMTDDEKREARATDPRAGAILDRCDDMPPEVLERLHGASRAGPRQSGDDAATAVGATSVPFPGPVHDPLDGRPAFSTGGVPWWDPAADASVSPGTDVIDVRGMRVARGSRVRLRPSRRADAQDIFFAGQVAVVEAVLHDVDGQVHVAVLLEDDPARDLHESYGRYLYFDPDELEPSGVQP